MSDRPRKLKNAVDAINLYGGVMGAKDVADLLGVEVANLKWQKVPVAWRISNGRYPVYLKADVEEHIKQRAKRAERAA